MELNKKVVGDAIKRGGSIRGAAGLLGMSYTAIQWWLATNGYKVEKRAVLVKRKSRAL
jgi:molybdenum-dependent DNA-binding transcriptional regulator ModE